MSNAIVPPHLLVTRPRCTTRPNASSAYVDVFWTPIVGGVGVATYRALTRLAAGSPGGAVTLEQLAELIGERSPDAPQQVWRAIDSLETEGVLGRRDARTIEVPVDLPLLLPDQIERLPAAVRDIHPAWLATAPIDDRHPSVMDGFVAVASFLDEALADRAGSPLRSIQRWQQAIRMAEDLHDDLIIGVTPHQHRDTARQLGDRCQELLDEVRRAQRELIAPTLTPEVGFRELRRAVSAVAEWINGQDPTPMGTTVS